MAIVYEKKGAIVYITISRPQVMNALDPETTMALEAAVHDFDDDLEARVAILTGAGDKAFCTGADLEKTSPPVRGPSQSVAGQFWRKGWQPFQMNSVFDRLETLDKPMVAAIHGFCIADGLEIAIRCDIRVASEDAVFGEPEAQMGNATVGGRLSMVIPPTVAMKMLLTGERIDALQALQWGLVTDVVPRPELMPTAERIAGRIAENAPLSVRATKLAARVGVGLALDRGMLMERLLFGMLRDTEDRAEGRRAFAEKRKPIYKGM